MRHFRYLSIIAAALVLGMVVPQSVRAAHSDPWVTTKAKIALFTNAGVSGTAVNVDTVDGRVTLHGKVGSKAEKAKAAAVVRKIDGVREVRNLLQVVRTKDEAAVKVSDKDIQTRVTEAFKADKQLAASGISVQSVNKGVVLLAGETPSMTTHLRAITTASGVPGVRQVASEVKGPETLVDAEAGQTAKKGWAADGDHGLTGAANDTWITSATKLRLLANSDTPALDISVDTRDGHVTLFGMVPSDQAKQAANAEARKVSGVQDVTNELQVVPSAQRKRIEAKDTDVESAVKHALGKRLDLTGNDVSVAVKDGVVRLTGTVPNEDARVTAATTARSTPGVRAVLWEDLKVSSADAR